MLAGVPLAGGPADSGAAAVTIYDSAGNAIATGATAAGQSANSGQGALQVVLPGTWSVSSTPAAGSQATASQAAGGGTVRHVATSASFALSATTALAAITTLTINLRDGATGAGTIRKSWQVTLPAATLLPIFFGMSGLSIVGSANTAMTLESAAAIGNLMVSVTLDGYDVS